MTPILTFPFLSEKKDDDLSPINSSGKMAAFFCSHSDGERLDCLKKQWLPNVLWVKLGLVL